MFSTSVHVPISVAAQPEA